MNLGAYAKQLVAKSGRSFRSGEIFAKVLTPNDDAGRHGVLIPSDAYSFFPYFPITNPTQNETIEFDAFDSLANAEAVLAYKYYKRYPERRVTRLHGILKNPADSPRLVVFLNATHTDGSSAYYSDCANSTLGGRFSELFRLVFGGEIAPTPGNFITRPVESSAFSVDPHLSELLSKFDEVRSRGWIQTMRSGDTGIGYTFETLLGIEENNDQTADFRGIEIKCSRLRGKGQGVASGKVNLFQAGPTWLQESSSVERLRSLGRLGADGLYTCHSQLTTGPNNLGLSLHVLESGRKIDLIKDDDALGFWAFKRLESRLLQKHSRAVFVKAEMRGVGSNAQFSYQELVYCDTPSIARFLALVRRNNIVFEFLMSERANGSVRNHGYPWRLTRQALLDQLFAFQIKLR